MVGKTKDAGFQIGVRKTFPVTLSTAWDYIFSKNGIKIWLGELFEFDATKPYKTINGIEGNIKVLKPLSHIRLSWKKEEWNNISTLQIRFIEVKNGTTISFHQEHLQNINQRVEMKLYWDKIIKQLSNSLK